MHWIDIAVFGLYMLALLSVGLFFFRQNQENEDYYVGGRKMSSWHIGLSVVATDVGGGFSIGLGGLGFTMGIAGSWMLFTGLVGAWLAAVFLIPKVKDNPKFARFTTFPEIFGSLFDKKTALLAGIISLIGYTGFTSAQVLAGAKLASGAIEGLTITHAVIIMGIITIVYTVMGGIKAVIYTDTVQWILLLSGLIFLGIPMAYKAVGGMEVIRQEIQPGFLSLTNVGFSDLANWAITIIPIWFVGMTLYQRIYACKDEKTARKAWYIAGIFEYPVMAFTGVILGVLARVAADQGMFTYLGAEDIAATDPEVGLPMLLRTIFPVGLLGLMLSAYFSAVLSTADSCLMAASGNLVTDIIAKLVKVKNSIRFSQMATLVLGGIALSIAIITTNVLNVMLSSYAFMVSGLFVPIIGGLFWRRADADGAFWAMLTGGTVTVALGQWTDNLPFELDANLFGIFASLIIFITISQIKWIRKIS